MDYDAEHELTMHDRHGHGGIRADLDRLVVRVDEIGAAVEQLAHTMGTGDGVAMRRIDELEAGVAAARQAVETRGNQLRGYVDGSIAEHVESAPHRHADGSE